MRAGGPALVILGLGGIASAGGCSSAPPRLAQLQVYIRGEGNVTVSYPTSGAFTSYLAGDPGCEGGVCARGFVNASALQESVGSAYEPGASVTLTEQPSGEWQFVSWQVTVWGEMGPSDHSSSTTTSNESTLVVRNAGQQMYVYATFDAHAVDAGADGAPNEAGVGDTPGDGATTSIGQDAAGPASCHGVPGPCSNYPDLDSCISSGCDWADINQCSGTAAACADILDEDSCDSQAGCSWSSNCGGVTAVTCSALMTSADCSNAGCVWD